MAPPGEKTEGDGIRKSDLAAKPKAERKYPDASVGDLTADDLRSIPVIPEGQRLQQGGVYVDLNDPTRREFTAAGDMIAAAGRRITSKSEVPNEIWNRLLRVQNPLGTGGSPSVSTRKSRTSTGEG